MDMAMNTTEYPELKDLLKDRLKDVFELLAEYGVTSIVDARTFWRKDYHQIWKELEAENELTTRTILGIY